MNRTSIIGNLGQDAQVRALDNGMSAIGFSVGVSERWTDAQGVKQERTDWFNCTLWRKSDKTAIAGYLKKGTKVLVEGKASARAYVNNAGDTVANLEIRVDNVELLSSQNQAQPQSSAPQTTSHQEPQYEQRPNGPITDDDLPF
jgi:single-strand DNA-binding protein